MVKNVAQNQENWRLTERLPTLLQYSGINVGKKLLGPIMITSQKKL